MKRLVLLKANSSHKSKILQDHGFVVSNKTPAFALLVIKDGKTIFKDTQGCARFGKNKKCVLNATSDTAFPLLSITKHFTAAAILMLEEEGKLSTNDEVMKYLNLPVRFKGITLKHLIHHTSGIPDYDSSAYDTDYLEKAGKAMTVDDFFAQTKSMKDLKPFGVKYLYSNPGYDLLGKVIEKFSGQTYEQFLKTRIFDRLGMKHTFVHQAITSQANYIFPYGSWPLLDEKSWLRVKYELFAAGGIWMSLNDYEKWIHAFDNNKIFKQKKTMTKFLSRGTYDDGSYIVERGNKNYGFGIAHNEREFEGKRYKFIGHNGSIPGAASNFIKLIDQNTWVVYFNNNEVYPDAFALLKQLHVKLGG